MSTGLKEQVNQSVRTWIKASEGLDDPQVLMAYDDRPKQAKPFINLRIRQHKLPVGKPESETQRNSGNVEERIRQNFYSTYRIEAFGEQAHPWLEGLGGKRWHSSIRKVLREESISAAPLDSISDISETVAGTWERRAFQDWRIDYRAETDWITVSAEFSALELTGELRDAPDQGDADALDLDFHLTD